MNTQQLPSSWQLGDKVQVVFSGNGNLQGKIIKVAFTEHSETRYDVEVPFNDAGPDGKPCVGHFRIHGVDQYFLSYAQEDWDKMTEEEADICSHCEKPIKKDENGIPICCAEATDDHAERITESRLAQ